MFETAGKTASRCHRRFGVVLDWWPSVVRRLLLPTLVALAWFVIGGISTSAATLHPTGGTNSKSLCRGPQNINAERVRTLTQMECSRSLAFSQREAKTVRCISMSAVDAGCIREAVDIGRTMVQCVSKEMGSKQFQCGHQYDAPHLLRISYSSMATKSAPGVAGRGGIGPVLKGQAGVDRVIAEIEASGGKVLGQEITVDAGGVRTRPDLFVEDAAGNRFFVEVKNGPSAGLTPNQKAAFPTIESSGGVPAGKNAAAAGLKPGTPIGPTPVVVRRLP